MRVSDFPFLLSIVGHRLSVFQGRTKKAGGFCVWVTLEIELLFCIFFLGNLVTFLPMNSFPVFNELPTNCFNGFQNSNAR